MRTTTCGGVSAQPGHVRRYADIPVVTSARHTGRATGGLADLLSGLGD